jgi:Holliday junction resolvase RusA-like endonuclease
MIEFFIPLIPQSLNHYAGRKNHWEYRQDKAQWERDIALLCRPKPQEPIKKAIVTLHYFFPTKARHDPDNYAGKMILDGLVKAGIIQDDSFDRITLQLKGGNDAKNPRTEIIIEELR